MSSIQAPPEKRSDPRCLARIAIFYGRYQNEILTDYSINLSIGGVFIETGKILPENSELTVKFNLPNSDTIIVTHARVAWTNDPGFLKKASLPPGMGIQFLDLSLENMHTIRVFLDEGKFKPTW